MLQEIAALSYLEYRSFINGLRAVATDPKRLIAWGFYALLIGNAWLQRSVQRRYVIPGATEHTWVSAIAPAVLGLLPAVILAILGYGILSAALRRRLRLGFSWPADGRFLCGSKLSPRLVVSWLQYRSIALLAIRWPLMLLILVGFPGIAQVPIATIVANGFGILAALVLNWQAANASALLARRNPFVWMALGAITLAIAVAALVEPVYAAIRNPNDIVKAIATHAHSLPPGSWLVQSLQGNHAAIVPFILLALAAGFVAIYWSDDCYPELWQSSARLFVLRRFARRATLWQGVGDTSLQRQLEAADQGASPRRRAGPTRSAADSVLAGPWTVLWKDWIAFSRAPFGALGNITRVILIVVVSVGVGLALSSGDLGNGLGSAAIGGILIAGSFWYVQILALMSASIAVDLRMPIWGLSGASFPARLLAWTFAASWKPALASGLVVAALGIAGRLPIAALAAFPAAALLTWATRVVGLAAFTILPSQADTRGPGAMLRVLIIYLLLAPAAIGATISGILAGAAAATVAGVTILIIESVALLLFASTRLEGNVMAFTAATSLEPQ